MESYQYLEKEVFRLEYGVEGIVRKRMAEYEGTYRICNVAGVFLCIICALPLMTAIALSSSSLVYVMCVDFLLIIVACAVFLFVIAGEKKGCFQMLLQEGDYTAEKKNWKRSGQNTCMQSIGVPLPQCTLASVFIREIGAGHGSSGLVQESCMGQCGRQLLL